MPSASATPAVTAEWLAPVSSTSRKGPLPSISTGAQIRPIWSRSVGATYLGSGASMSTSGRGSSTPGIFVTVPDAAGVPVAPDEAGEAGEAGEAEPGATVPAGAAPAPSLATPAEVGAV